MVGLKMEKSLDCKELLENAQAAIAVLLFPLLQASNENTKTWRPIWSYATREADRWPSHVRPASSIVCRGTSMKGVRTVQQLEVR